MFVYFYSQIRISFDEQIVWQVGFLLHEKS